MTYQIVVEHGREFHKVSSKIRNLLATRCTINNSSTENQELIDQYDKQSYEILIERWNQEHKPKTKTKKVEEEKDDINEFSFEF